MTRAATGAALALGILLPAIASAQQQGQVETVVVTGSRIRNASEPSTPVVTSTRSVIEIGMVSMSTAALPVDSLTDR